MTVFYISSRLPVTRIFWSSFFVRILKIVIVARTFPGEFPREVPREQSTLPLVVLDPLPAQTGRFCIWYFEIFHSYGKRMSITLENLWYVKQESIKPTREKHVFDFTTESMFSNSSRVTLNFWLKTLNITFIRYKKRGHKNVPFAPSRLLKNHSNPNLIHKFFWD